MLSRLRKRCVLTVALVGVFAMTAGPAAAADPAPPPWLKVENGQTQPQFDFAQAIEEIVFVETELDSDGDGRRDRVRIRISRPAETETQGYKVPVVFEHSPYRGDFGDAVNHDVDFDVLPQENLFGDRAARGAQRARRALEAHHGRTSARARAARGSSARADLPGSSLDNYFVPRGYAVVSRREHRHLQLGRLPDGRRPRRDARHEGRDRLAERPRAAASTRPATTVEADWTTGAVGMTGVSYNGTLPNQVATTGVEGLETIIPVSAISSWYDYYRANGLVVAPHSETQGVGENGYLGEDTDVLAVLHRRQPHGRPLRRHDPVPRARAGPGHRRLEPVLGGARLPGQGDRIRASVFVVHGLNDWNVKTKAFAEWWYRARAARHPAQDLAAQRRPRRSRRARSARPTRSRENRWFDHELFGVENGIMSEPRATIQREDGSYSDEPDWPAPGARNTTLELSARNASAPGELTAGSWGRDWRRLQSFVDRGRELDTDDVLIQGPDDARSDRLVYRTRSLRRDVRISGTPEVSLRMSIDNRNAANLTAVLVDYGAAGSADAPVMVTRGWLDPQNRYSISRSVPVRQDRLYRFDWDLQPDDYVFEAGHRIGLVVVSTDHDYTIRPAPGTRLTLLPAHSSVSLPVVGGRWALGL